MNFLRLRRVAPWAFSLVAVGCGSGVGEPIVADAAAIDAATPNDAGSVNADLAAPESCASSGTGRLRVSLGLDPGLAARSPEVWLLVRCGLGGDFERVLRWDRSATQTIDALGPGSYEVVGSSFLAPWSSSPRLTLAEGATAAVSLTLPPAPAVLAQLRSAALQPGASAVWRASATLASGDVTASVATIEIEARPYAADPTSPGAPTFLSVTAVVRNPCASDRCPSYRLRALEVRTRAGDGPAGMAGFMFPTDERLDAGQSKSVPQPLVVRGSLPDATHGVELALYGDIVRPPRPMP